MFGLATEITQHLYNWTTNLSKWLRFIYN